MSITLMAQVHIWQQWIKSSTDDKIGPVGGKLAQGSHDTSSVIHQTSPRYASPRVHEITTAWAARKAFFFFTNQRCHYCLQMVPTCSGTCLLWVSHSDNFLHIKHLQQDGSKCMKANRCVAKFLSYYELFGNQNYQINYMGVLEASKHYVMTCESDIANFPTNTVS